MPMHIEPLHSWDVTPAEAIALQRELAGRIEVQTPLPRWDLVAGADISYSKGSDTLYASVVVWRASDGAIVEGQDVVQQATFPYVPGLLSFREAPAVLAAFAKLQTVPDAVMCDGQGTAHPRRFGLACHLGLWLNRPCFGCAKSLLFGKFQEPDRAAGSQAPLVAGKEVLGTVLRTRDGIRPVFVSPGHRIDLASSVAVAGGCVRGYRIPEPTRQAHLRVNRRRLEATEAPKGLFD